MLTLVFQNPPADEPFRSVVRQAERGGATVVVVGPSAAALAAEPAGDRLVVRLALGSSAPADGFDPLDALPYLAGMDLDDAVVALLEPLWGDLFPALQPAKPSGVVGEPVWRAHAIDLFAALVRYQLAKKAPAPLVAALNQLLTDDVVYNLAVLLDNEGKRIEPNVFAVVAAFLQRGDAERSVILSLIQGAASGMVTTPARRAVERTTFDLGAVAAGEATVYVALPATPTLTQALVARLWLVALGRVAAGRAVVVTDAAASPAVAGPLRDATRRAGGPAEVWTFWDGPDALRAARPADWASFAGSAGSARVVGPVAPPLAAGLAAAFGSDPAGLARLGPGEALALWGAPADAPPAAPPDPPPPGHVVTFVPSPGDGWVASVAEAIAAAAGPVVVVESAGACHARTAADRARRGRVVRLDPFGVLGPDPDAFNPLDLLDLDLGPHRADVFDFAEFLVTAGTPSTDPFWHNSTVNLMRAVLQYLRTVPDKPFTLGELWNVFHGDDVVYNLNVVVDKSGKQLPPECQAEISVFLQRYESLRLRVLTEATKSVSLFGMPAARQAVERTTFDLGAVAAGEATVYVAMPAALWRTHGLLARLWLVALLRVVASAGGRAVVVADAAAAAAVAGPLRDALRLPAGSAAVWTFWDGPDALRAARPADWAAFAGSAGSARVVGPVAPPTAACLAGAFGADPADLARLGPGQVATLWGTPPDDPARVAATSAVAGHVVTFAAAGADRWAGAVVAAVAAAAGPVVVVESAGACHARTAAGRAARGRVVRLDPFGVLGPDPDAFNPLDLLRMPDLGGLAEPAFFAERLLPSDPVTIDPYWRAATVAFLQGLLGYLAAAPDKAGTLIELRALLTKDDVVYNLAVVLDTIGKQLPKETYQQVAIFLQKADMERVSLLAITLQALRLFADPRLAAHVERTTFDLAAFRAGEPVAIYVEVPPFRLPTHGLLVHLWIDALLTLTHAGAASPRPLFVLDSPHPDALFPALEAAQRSDRCDLWTFWESLDQLRANHPSGWSAFLANASRVEVVGPANPVVTADLAALFGHAPEAVRSLAPGQTFVLYDAPRS